MSRRKKVLEGYKREGKRFISPLRQLPKIRESSYINDMLPELIWLGLIHDRYGYHFGAKTLETIIKVTKDWPFDAGTPNYALQSAYASLSESQKDAVRLALRREDFLERIQSALAPLVLLYDGFSLAFLGPPQESIDTPTLVARISGCVAKHMNKFETPGIVLHGTMLLTRLAAGTIKFSSEVRIPDFNAVITDPESGEAKMAASFMRATALAEFGMLNIRNNWSEYFWNRGVDLSPCTATEEDDAQ